MVIFVGWSWSTWRAVRGQPDGPTSTAARTSTIVDAIPARLALSPRGVSKPGKPPCLHIVTAVESCVGSLEVDALRAQLFAALALDICGRRPAHERKKLLPALRFPRGQPLAAPDAVIEIAELRVLLGRQIFGHVVIVLVPAVSPAIPRRYRACRTDNVLFGP